MSQRRIAFGQRQASRSVRYYVRMCKLARDPRSVAHYAAMLELALYSEGRA